MQTPHIHAHQFIFAYLSRNCKNSLFACHKAPQIHPNTPRHRSLFSRTVAASRSLAKLPCCGPLQHGPLMPLGTSQKQAPTRESPSTLYSNSTMSQVMIQVLVVDLAICPMIWAGPVAVSSAGRTVSYATFLKYAELSCVATI